MKEAGSSYDFEPITHCSGCNVPFVCVHVLSRRQTCRATATSPSQHDVTATELGNCNVNWSPELYEGFELPFIHIYEKPGINVCVD